LKKLLNKTFVWVMNVIVYDELKGITVFKSDGY